MRIIEGNGGVFGKDGLGGGQDGMRLWGLRGHTIVQNGIIRNCSTGFDVRDCDTVEFRNIRVEAGPHNFDEKWARAFLLGFAGKPETANGLIIIRNCHVESLGKPSGDYSKKNGDCINFEENKPGYPVSLLVEDTYLGGASDSCADVKGYPPAVQEPPVAIFRNVIFGPSHRALRAWDHTRVYHQSCTWLPGSNEQIWTNSPAAVVQELA